MISIITPVHNCLSHNEIFLESLIKYTYSPYELIVIDNASTDGSYELFKGTGCKIIRNEKNLCYPESMNLGLAQAQGDFICFLNNDVFCGINWDKHLLDGMMMYNLDVVSPCGIERMPSFPLTHLFSKRWRKAGEKRHLGANADGLRRLMVSMYGDWEKFCNTIFEMYYPQIIEGIVGNCVFLRKSVLEKIGLLDERIQSSDWDLYLRIKKRAEDIGDVHRVMTVCWAYLHHFIRTTLKSNPEPFACTHPKNSIEEKWDKETVKRLWPFPNEVQERPSFYKEPINYWGYKWGKIASRRIKTDHENQWIQFWKKLDRA
jgi:GT2 family glycosyltransferase